MQGEHRRQSSAGKGSLFRSTPLREPLPKRFVRHFMRSARTRRSARRPGHYRQRLQGVRLQHGLSNGRDATQPHRLRRGASTRRSLAPIVKGRNGLQCPSVEVPLHIHERQEDNPGDQGQHPAAHHSYAEEVQCADLPAPSGPGSVPRAATAVRFTSKRRTADAVGQRFASNCSIPTPPGTRCPFPPHGGSPVHGEPLRVFWRLIGLAVSTIAVGVSSHRMRAKLKLGAFGRGHGGRARFSLSGPCPSFAPTRLQA